MPSCGQNCAKESGLVPPIEARLPAQCSITIAGLVGWNRAHRCASNYSAPPTSPARSAKRRKSFALTSWSGALFQVGSRSSWMLLRRLRVRCKRHRDFGCAHDEGQGAALAQSLNGARESDTVEGAVEYFGKDDLFHHPGFRNGDFEIQDISSQMVGRLANPQPGQTWWDACAGEGGKLLHLSELMDNKGLIWASDRASWRFEKLKRRAARARVLTIGRACGIGSAKLPHARKFDGILVDAPCSGVGTWGRNPHARWTTTEQDVMELAESQKTLLKNVTASLKHGESWSMRFAQ
jgi:hypothetical protein